MRFHATQLESAFVIDIEPIVDNRGCFARAWCEDEFRQHGIGFQTVQCNLSFNVVRGTLRGLHYQREPHAEIKLVRCTRGSIFDVAVDLRPESPTCFQWFGVELSADNHRMLLVPKGFAHGYQTLEDETEVFYQVSTPYHRESEGGIHWNDPLIGIRWPISDPVVSAKDSAIPLLRA
jgi:dTDP-4-dehydrorhamnose 3,5-epimerase